MQRLILLDMYQTLVDVDFVKSKEREQAGWDKVVAELQAVGITASREALLAGIEKRRAAFYSDGRTTEAHHHDLTKLMQQTVAEDFGAEVPFDQIETWIFEYRKLARAKTTLFPGVSKMLEQLKENYDLAIASYAQQAYSEPQLRELGIERFFKYFFWSSELGVRKSQPEFYRECLSRSGQAAASTLMIGDNYATDVVVPGTLGIKAIWVKNPMTLPTQDVPDGGSQALATIETSSLAELPALIAERWT